MEKLVNCAIIMDIEFIERISGANEFFEVIFLSKDNVKYKIEFDFVWDIRCSIENGYIDRFANFVRDAKEESSILLVENSEYIKYFERQVSGTRPVDKLKNYILFDAIDTVVEILTIKEPVIVKIG